LVTVPETDNTDEVGLLARTFNSMAGQVQNTLATMEQQVADRTREVQIAAQVGKELVQTGDLNSSLKNTVETIARDFNLYAAQVYLFDPAAQLLVLRASSGEVGEQLVQRGHRLLLGQNSLNSKAATERRVVMASDTSQDPNFKANPLRPYIRSEIALPLLDGSRLLGVLDLQSDEAGRFTQGDVLALQLLADEVTFAIRNSELLYEAIQARQGLEEQARRLTRTGWQDFLNAIQRGERIQATYQTSETLAMEAEGREMTAPIQIAGQTVGAFTVEVPAQSGAEAEIDDFLQVAAQAVAQQVDNLRLIAQGEQYRAEAEEAVRRLTREGWQGYIGNTEFLTDGFAYDGEIVQPAKAMPLDATFERKLLELNGEPLGELWVDKAALTPEAEQILTAVSEQLTAHIENLRLSDQMQVALQANQRQNTILASLNRVVSAASSARDLPTLLDGAAHEILQALHARNVGIAVFTDASHTQLKVMADANINPADVSAVGVSIPVVGNTSTEYVLTNRHSLVVENAQTDPRTASIHSLMRGRGTHSLIIVPLLARGEIIGTIGVDSDDPHRHFSNEEVSLVETMAGQLAGAIDNLRSFENTQRRANREALINEITAKIQGTVTVDSALQTTIQELGKALKARKTRVALGLTPTEPETNGHTTPN
jgi:GAF domain-containing protein